MIIVIYNQLKIVIYNQLKMRKGGRKVPENNENYISGGPGAEREVSPKRVETSSVTLGLSSTV